MIAAFDLAQVHRSPARFDFVKLENMNGHYLRDTPDDELFGILIDTLPYLEGGKAVSDALDDRKRAQLRAALPGLKARAKTLNELVDGAAFLFVQRPLPMDEKAQKLLSTDAKARLAALGPKLAALPEWTAAATEGVVRDLSVELGVKLGDLAQPLRAALTGRSTSPGIFDVLEILGREESLGRIADQSA
jgi:glutamyl-tRNA synthetase